MRVKEKYVGKEEEMKLEVTQKQENKKLVTRQNEGLVRNWESIQEFQGDRNNTPVKYAIPYELPTTGKIANLFRKPSR
jgi:hypothetical protein